MDNWLNAALGIAVVCLSIWVWNTAENTADLRNEVSILRSELAAKNYETEAVTTASELRESIRVQAREIFDDTERILSEHSDFADMPVPEHVIDGLRAPQIGSGSLGATGDAAR